jgi:hypothetical protein
MKAIASVVPTVRSFAGRGDMNETQDFSTRKPETHGLLYDLENQRRRT